MSVIRVLLLDDHELVREGVKAALGPYEDILIVAEAATAGEALAAAVTHSVDVALLDVKLPDGNGVEVCREIRSAFPQTQCLILTSYRGDQALYRAIMAGASGYLLKRGMTGPKLADAVRRVASGASLLDAALAGRVLDFIRGQVPRDEFAALSARERQLLELIGRGQSNREIADALHLGEQTVKNYVSRMLTKLGLQRRSQAAALVAGTLATEDEGAYE